MTINENKVFGVAESRAEKFLRFANKALKDAEEIANIAHSIKSHANAINKENAKELKNSIKKMDKENIKIIENNLNLSAKAIRNMNDPLARYINAFTQASGDIKKALQTHREALALLHAKGWRHHGKG